MSVPGVAVVSVFGEEIKEQNWVVLTEVSRCGGVSAARHPVLTRTCGLPLAERVEMTGTVAEASEA